MLSHPWIKSPRGRIPTIAVLRTLTTGRRYHRPVTTLVLFAFFSHQRSYTAPKMPPSEQPRGPATLLPAAPCSPAAKRPEGATIRSTTPAGGFLSCFTPSEVNVCHSARRPYHKVTECCVLNASYHRVSKCCEKISDN